MVCLLSVIFCLVDSVCCWSWLWLVSVCCLPWTLLCGIGPSSKYMTIHLFRVFLCIDIYLSIMFSLLFIRYLFIHHVFSVIFEIEICLQLVWGVGAIGVRDVGGI